MAYSLKMATALALLVFTFVSPASGFHTAMPSSVSFRQSKLWSSVTDESSMTTTDLRHVFWRKPRDEEDIKSHISNALRITAMEFPVEFYEDRSRSPTVEVISAEPPLVVIHDFVSGEVCDEIIETALDFDQMKRSKTGVEQSLSESRTSSNCWLDDSSCEGPSRLIAEQIASITGIPPANMENLQVAKYEPGQQFTLHTDHQNSFNELDCRGRLATFLIYLAEPEQGGDTWFPGLHDDKNPSSRLQGDGYNTENDVYVAPSKGSAVFFWNTVEKPGCENYNDEMFLNVDMRLRHAGLPVEMGEKWIANRWIHPIDFGGGVKGLSCANQ